MTEATVTQAHQDAASALWLDVACSGLKKPGESDADFSHRKFAEAFARFEHDAFARHRTAASQASEGLPRLVRNFLSAHDLSAGDPASAELEARELDAISDLRYALTAPPTSDAGEESFQAEVGRWMLECFGEEIAADRIERADRFLEEALELAQTIPGFTVERARALVEYVFARPVGERGQEVGGVGVTLAALCNTYDLNISDEWQRELARVWTKIEAIRAKQASKPTGSALPIALSPPTSIEPVQKVHELTSGEEMRLRERLNAITFLTCVSGDGPTPYLKVHFNSLAAAHAAHDELIALKREQP